MSFVTIIKNSNDVERMYGGSFYFLTSQRSRRKSFINEVERHIFAVNDHCVFHGATYLRGKKKFQRSTKVNERSLASWLACEISHQIQGWTLPYLYPWFIFLINFLDKVYIFLERKKITDFSEPEIYERYLFLFLCIA